MRRCWVVLRLLCRVAASERSLTRLRFSPGSAADDAQKKKRKKKVVIDDGALDAPAADEPASEDFSDLKKKKGKSKKTAFDMEACVGRKLAPLTLQLREGARADRGRGAGLGR